MTYMYIYMYMYAGRKNPNLYVYDPCFTQSNPDILHPIVLPELLHNRHVCVHQGALTNRVRNEPRHDKTNKMSVCPVKTQISLGICPVWSESSLCTQWVAKDPMFLHSDSEISDQTEPMPRLIWVFAGLIAVLLVLSCRGSNGLYRYVPEEFLLWAFQYLSLTCYLLNRYNFIISLTIDPFSHLVWKDLRLNWFRRFLKFTLPLIDNIPYPVIEKDNHTAALDSL